MNEAIRRLDDVMNELVEADQNGDDVEPLRIAHELGEIKTLLLEREPASAPRP